MSSTSDDSQDAFEPYYSETYSENSSLSLQDSQHSLASVSDGVEDNPGLLLMHEYMMTVSPSRLGSVMELHRGLEPFSQEELFSAMIMMCLSVKPVETVSQTSVQSVKHQNSLSNLRTVCQPSQVSQTS